MYTLWLTASLYTTWVSATFHHTLWLTACTAWVSANYMTHFDWGLHKTSAYSISLIHFDWHLIYNMRKCNIHVYTLIDRLYTILTLTFHLHAVLWLTGCILHAMHSMYTLWLTPSVQHEFMYSVTLIKYFDCRVLHSIKYQFIPSVQYGPLRRDTSFEIKKKYKAIKLFMLCTREVQVGTYVVYNPINQSALYSVLHVCNVVYKLSIRFTFSFSSLFEKQNLGNMFIELAQATMKIYCKCLK